MRKNPVKKVKKQTGAAIIVALFVVSLTAIAAIAMVAGLQLDIRRTELLLNDTQAKLYAKGSLDWAIEQLINDLKNSQSTPNKLVDPTPIHSPEQEVNGMIVSSTIYDAQGRFNLNNLADIKNQPIFVKLIQTVNNKISENTAKNIAAAVSDWVSLTAGNNTLLTDYYLKLKPPYRAPHRLMASVSELRLVKDMTPELYGALSRYVIALPETMTAVNLNHVPAPVMVSLSSLMTLAAAKMLVMRCRATPFTDMQQFKDADVVKKSRIFTDQMTLVSNYFLVRTNVKVKQQVFTLYTLLQRSGTVLQPAVAVIWQSKGTL